MDFKNHVFEREITEIANGIQITKNKYGDKDFRYPRYIKEKVLDLLDKGMSHYEIGLFLNINKTSLCRWQAHLRDNNKNKYTPPKYKDDPKILGMLDKFKNKNIKDEEKEAENTENTISTPESEITSSEKQYEMDFEKGDDMFNNEMKELKEKFDKCKASSPVNRPKYPSDLKEKVVELINSGHKLDDLSLALNLYPNTVKRWVSDSRKPKRKRKYVKKVIRHPQKNKPVEPTSVLPPKEKEERDIESRVKAKLPNGIIISASNASDLVKIIKQLQE